MSAEIIVALLIGITILLGLYVLLYKKKRLSRGKIKEIQKLWKEVENEAVSQPEQAIMKADKLLDHALKLAGFKGNLGEKLQGARQVFSDNNAVWSAHKLRNQIAHEIGIKATSYQAKGALNGFKRALSDLGIPL
ncbi:MAG: hypothetical protein Q8P95_02545 [bacterium]|nr:hypothetical protein [bacterium]